MSALLLMPDPTATGDDLELELAAVLADVRAALPGVTVSTSLPELLEQGHRDVVALPLVPGAAGYDPGILELALRRQAPGATVTLARALGPHPLLVELAARRVLAALDGPALDGPALDGSALDGSALDGSALDSSALDGWATAQVGVLVVGPGSHDPEANAEVAKVARLLQEGRDFALVELAFLQDAAPDVATGLARCRALGADRVVVLTHVVVDPGLADRVRAQLSGEEHVRLAGHLDASPELTALVVERHHEARHGDLRMSCDVCAYRELQPHPHEHADV